MKSRRTFLLSVVSGLVALGVIVAPAIAAELMGYMTKVDPAARTITVMEKGGTETVVKVTKDTEWVTKKGTSSVDLEKIEKYVKKAQEAGKKGIMVKVTHEGKVASKIEPSFARKKAEATP